MNKKAALYTAILIIAPIVWFAVFGLTSFLYGCVTVIVGFTIYLLYDLMKVIVRDWE